MKPCREALQGIQGSRGSLARKPCNEAAEGMLRSLASQQKPRREALPCKEATEEALQRCLAEKPCKEAAEALQRNLAWMPLEEAEEALQARQENQGSLVSKPCNGAKADKEAKEALQGRVARTQ